eukprot:1711849-Prymnesium_polylepis.1
MEPRNPERCDEGHKRSNARAWGEFAHYRACDPSASPRTPTQSEIMRVRHATKAWLIGSRI